MMKFSGVLLLIAVLLIFSVHDSRARRGRGRGRSKSRVTHSFCGDFHSFFACFSVLIGDSFIVSLFPFRIGSNWTTHHWQISWSGIRSILQQQQCEWICFCDKGIFQFCEKILFLSIFRKIYLENSRKFISTFFLREQKFYKPPTSIMNTYSAIKLPSCALLRATPGLRSHG